MTKKHLGGCHCGAVRFEAELDESKGGSRCNCSICMKIAQVGVILKPSAFKLLSEESSVAQYRWGPQISIRHFCKVCGIHCFGRGHLAELGGEFVSVNLNCLDDVDVGLLEIQYWDGRHNGWEKGTKSTPWPIA
jgi:hypothetical protein